MVCEHPRRHIDRPKPTQADIADDAKAGDGGHLPLGGRVVAVGNHRQANKG